MADLEIPFAQRLIVALDFEPKGTGYNEVLVALERDVVSFVERIEAVDGVVVKINSALRALGYGIITSLRLRGAHTFADLKLCDIPNTMETDAAILARWKPSMVTVMCSAGVKGMRAVKQALIAHGSQDTQVLGVTVLTSLTSLECQAIFNQGVETAVIGFARLALEAGIDGLICSPKELAMLRADREFDGLQLVTPGIRPAWVALAADDQQRVMTPGDAIAAGADRIVVGRPITQAKDPADAVRRTLAEIEEGLVERARKGASS